ncbi:hypothetical protein BP5796_09821 [Coleophoma crateriformis]|uniref:FAD-binding domain-containing protein n=1 Tax=Coleophoma crateriformis TaxID=565419 RepID=A0A3D8QZ36_9HELO|nr:hypothetical protein BP5796_09821 [Coleophoma crateriformis]
MSTSAQMNDVLIVGGGVAGLVLAQGLKHRGIPFRLFERDSHTLSKGYRFRVVDDGLDALKKTIRPSLWALFEATNPGTGQPNILLLDAVTGKKIKYAEIPKSRSVNFDRRWIRELLSIGIEEQIHFNKAFQKYDLLPSDEHNSGGVRVSFADGTTATGRTLVAADGANSKVRKQFLPDIRLLDVERSVLWGRTLLTPEFQERFNRPDIMAEYLSTIVDSQSPSHPCLFAPLKWPNNGKLSGLSPKLSDQSDYMFVTLSFETPSAKLDTEEARKQFALEITKTWDPQLKTMFSMMEDTAVLPIYSSRPDVKVWPTDERITLMGDSIHAMAPSGGSGGYTAVLDAAALTEVISQSWNGGDWVKLNDGICGYEKGMRERAKQSINVSFSNGKWLWAGKDWQEYAEIDR